MESYENLKFKQQFFKIQNFMDASKNKIFSEDDAKGILNTKYFYFIYRMNKKRFTSVYDNLKMIQFFYLVTIRWIL